MTDKNITKDAMYDAVAPDDFESMLELDRYGARSSAFDKIISATHDHFWDPLDKAYIDFDEPFDMENQALVPEDLVIALSTDYVSDHLSDPKQRIRFINQSVLRSFSSILHGEQAALGRNAGPGQHEDLHSVSRLKADTKPDAPVIFPLTAVKS